LRLWSVTKIFWNSHHFEEAEIERLKKERKKEQQREYVKKRTQQ
jgi:hypothetical protein